MSADADVEFSWTDEEVADMYDNTSFIIAADGAFTKTPSTPKQRIYRVPECLFHDLLLSHQFVTTMI